MHKGFFKYLSIGEVEENWGAYITSVGYSKVEPNERYPNDQHPETHKLTWNRGRILHDYYLVFISNGRGVFGSAKTEPVPVSAGTCFFLFPQVWHRYKPDGKSGWEEYWVGFNGRYMETLIPKFFTPEKPFISVGSNKDLLVLFHKLIDLTVSSSLGYPQQLLGVTLQILGLVQTTATYKNQENDPAGKMIAKAKFIMEKSFENQLDMEDLARQLPMSYSSFRKAFKKISGESPNQYHLNLRLNRAKDLLTTTVLNVSEIADHTGFDSVYYFSKIFKQKTGVSPNSFRKTFLDQSRA